MVWRVFLLVVSLLCSTLLGCEGAITDPPRDRPPPGTPPPVVCDDTIRPGRAPLRRLTVAEYDNSVRDLFGVSSGPATRLVDNERGVLIADQRIVTTLLAEQYLNASEEVAARLTAPGELDGLLGCDRGATGDDACARQMIERLAPKVYRRPADATEVDALYALYEAGRDDGGFEIGVTLVIEGMLQSPNFLYRAELAPVGADAIVRLDGYAVATRLSYFLWGTTPDEALLAAAAAGELDSDEGIENHARRMVMDPQAEEGIQQFFARYLELDKLADVEKDGELFPEWNDTIPQLFEQETEAFIREVLDNHGGSFVTFMTAPWSMMNAELAAYYGVSGPSGSAFERVELDPTHYSGLFTQGATMATRARTYETSPIHRGMFVRGTVMCGVVPDVPEGLDITPPPPDPTLTTRERLARHRESAECRACHEQLDPLGFAFEHFDAAGRFRPDENGLDIDATGIVTNSDVDGDFDGAPDLAQRLSGSVETQACFAQRWFPAALGRGDERGDDCSMDEITARFADNDFDVRELLVALALSDPFVYRVSDQDTLTEVSP